MAKKYKGEERRIGGPYSRREGYGRRFEDRPTSSQFPSSFDELTWASGRSNRRVNGDEDRRQNWKRPPGDKERRTSFGARRAEDKISTTRPRFHGESSDFGSHEGEGETILDKLSDLRKGPRRAMTAGRRAGDLAEAIKVGRPMTIDIGDIVPKIKKGVKGLGIVGAALTIGSLASQAHAATRAAATAVKSQPVYKEVKDILPAKPKVMKMQ